MTVFLNIKKHGKGAGNTGLTQATYGGTPIVDEEKTCNTKVLDFCKTSDYPELCWDNAKYDPNQTPSCPLYTGFDYICNTAAANYCIDVSISLSLSLPLSLSPFRCQCIYFSLFRFFFFYIQILSYIYYRLGFGGWN